MAVAGLAAVIPRVAGAAAAQPLRLAIQESSENQAGAPQSDLDTGTSGPPAGTTRLPVGTRLTAAVVAGEPVLPIRAMADLRSMAVAVALPAAMACRVRQELRFGAVLAGQSERMGPPLPAAAAPSEMALEAKCEFGQGADMIDAETFEIEPIRVGRIWAQSIQFDAAIFSLSGTYTGNIVETTAGPVLISLVAITPTAADTIEISLSESETADLDVLIFDLKRGVHQGYVLLDVIRTDDDPDEPVNLLLRLPVIRSL